MNKDLRQPLGTRTYGGGITRRTNNQHCNHKPYANHNLDNAIVKSPLDNVGDRHSYSEYKGKAKKLFETKKYRVGKSYFIDSVTDEDKVLFETKITPKTWVITRAVLGWRKSQLEEEHNAYIDRLKQELEFTDFESFNLKYDRLINTAIDITYWRSFTPFVSFGIDDRELQMYIETIEDLSVPQGYIGAHYKAEVDKPLNDDRLKTQYAICMRACDIIDSYLLSSDRYFMLLNWQNARSYADSLKEQILSRYIANRITRRKDKSYKSTYKNVLDASYEMEEHYRRYFTGCVTADFTSFIETRSRLKISSSKVVKNDYVLLTHWVQYNASRYSNRYSNLRAPDLLLDLKSLEKLWNHKDCDERIGFHHC